MRITVHRGTDQIGGCITEYEHNGWRLFVDYGEQLPGTAVAGSPLKIEGLNCGDLSRSALLVTHYHGDHIGNISEVPTEVPIYMGKITRDIAIEHSKRLGTVDKDYALMARRLEDVGTFTPGEIFAFGDFRVLPVVIDHSAFDAYAFRIETDGVKVFHTGDFRVHGFRGGKLRMVLEVIVGKVDYVVCEGTNVSRADATQLSEYVLKQRFISAFRRHKYNVVYLSSTNIDRLFGLYHAALEAHRPFYVDSYQKSIMDIVAGHDHIWKKVSLYNYDSNFAPIALWERGGDFVVRDEFKDKLERRGYVLIARGNEKFDRLIEQMPPMDKKRYLSMWNGYIDPVKAAYNQKLAKSLGNKFEYMHTSGHVDMDSLKTIIGLLSPKAVIPIHTDDPLGFNEMIGTTWSVLLLNDGEMFDTGDRR